MSSWQPSLVSRPLVALAMLAVACKETPRSDPTPASPSEQAALPTAPPPEAPWFQGTWAGKSEDATASSGPQSASLKIDAAGSATGGLGAGFVVRGVVDLDTLRLEAEGPDGHGVAVLHRQQDQLRGTFRYAAPAATEGHRAALELSRTEL